MARPNLKFIDVEEPLRLRCAERFLLKMKIKPRALGMCKLTVYLEASTVNFAGGSKEIVTEFEVNEAQEWHEVDIYGVISGKKPSIYTFNLNVKVKNADGQKNDDFLLVKLDCKNPMTEEEQTVDFWIEPLVDVETEAHTEDETNEDELTVISIEEEVITIDVNEDEEE